MLTQCCKEFLSNREPLKAREGEFHEIQKCTTCGKRLELRFKCHSVIGYPPWACDITAAKYME